MSQPLLSLSVSRTNTHIHSPDVQISSACECKSKIFKLSEMSFFFFFFKRKGLTALNYSFVFKLFYYVNQCFFSSIIFCYGIILAVSLCFIFTYDLPYFTSRQSCYVTLFEFVSHTPFLLLYLISSLYFY